MIAFPYDSKKKEITIAYDTECQKYITMDSILYDEVKNNIQRYITYRPKIVINTSTAFNYPQFIATFINRLNGSKASPQPTLTAEAAIILKLSEYNDYIENGYFLIYDILKLAKTGGKEDNAER